MSIQTLTMVDQYNFSMLMYNLKKLGKINVKASQVKQYIINKFKRINSLKLGYAIYKHCLNFFLKLRDFLILTKTNKNEYKDTVTNIYYNQSEIELMKADKFMKLIIKEDSITKKVLKFLGLIG